VSSVSSVSSGRAPLEGLRMPGSGLALTLGVLDDSGFCLLGGEADAPLSVYAYGPAGPSLAEDLAAHLAAWEEAGRPGVERLRVTAYPKGVPVEVPSGAVAVERPHTVLVLSWGATPSPS
jgi:protein-L-isoaspartate(D-aspartate) O-methyltransferase